MASRVATRLATHAPYSNQDACILVGLILGDEARLSQFFVPNLRQGVDETRTENMRAFLYLIAADGFEHPVTYKAFKLLPMRRLEFLL